MHKSFVHHFFVSILLLQPAASFAQMNAYEQSLQKWKQERKAALTAENGWLNLAGLFWLKPGKNTVGTSAGYDLIFPSKNMGESLGYIEWKENAVWFFANNNSKATINKIPFQSGIIYHADSSKQPTVAIGSLRFSIIKRGDKLGVRLRDVEQDAVKQFTGIPMFAIDTNWRIKARWIPAAAYKTIAITNVLGQSTQQATPGTLVFEKDGNTYSLQSLEEEGKLYIVFGDETNAETTYGAGRFLYADMPTGSGMVLVDFNKAINPPCAFTPFATCPLPPKQNQLPIKIEAGEKDYGRH
jgi:uncharacterized protein (DUF1684 family)